MKKNLMKKIMLTITTTAIMVTSLATMVFAKGNDDTYIQIDTAGNSFMAGYNISMKSDVQNDLIGAGYNVLANNSEISKNVALAGYNVTLNGSAIGCDAFLAGYNIAVNSEIDNNIFAVGYSLNFNEGTTANAVNAAGTVINFYGESNCINANGMEIYFNGTVNGDAVLEGEKVTIGDDADIKGTLTIRSENEPVVPEGKFAKEYAFELKTIEDEDNDLDDAISEAVESSVKAATKTNTIMSKIKDRCISKVYWTLAYILIALFLCVFTNNSVNDAKEMIKTRRVPMAVSGVLALIGFPAAAVVCGLTYVGIPMAAIFLVAVGLLIAISIPFASASMGRLVFDKIFTKLNKTVASIIAVAVVSLVKIIPIINVIINIACIIYTLGYVVQRLYLNMRGGKPTTAAPEKAIVVEGIEVKDQNE